MKMDRFLKIFSRSLLTGLLLFEFLNYFGILKYSLSFTWLGLIITCLLVWLMLEVISFFLKKYCGQSISGWGMMTATIAIYLDSFGDIFHFFNQIWWYDRVAHLVGGGVVAGLTFNIVWIICRSRKINIGFSVISFISLAITSLLGTMYEAEEYFEDYFFGSSRLGEGPDTADDMILNMIGGLLVILVINIYLQIKKKRSAATLTKIEGNLK